MKKKIAFYGLLVLALAGMMSFNKVQDGIGGAWLMKDGTREIVWVLVDGYSTQTSYDKVNKRFLGTWGGPYKVEGNAVIIQTEYNTMDSTRIGQPARMKFTVNGDKLNVDGRISFTRIDNGAGQLAGNWRISGRMQDGKMVEGPQGARKTLKILSGTRFQWVAINPDVKGFYGTGGGTYIFANGKYTENIEFFSRDSTRVGAALTFDGKVENGAWHHSGLNSRGEALNEIWRRVQ